MEEEFRINWDVKLFGLDNYPQHILKKELCLSISHLKLIKQSRERYPNFHHVGAEEIIEKRITELKSSIKKIK